MSKKIIDEYVHEYCVELKLKDRESVGIDWRDQHLSVVRFAVTTNYDAKGERNVGHLCQAETPVFDGRLFLFQSVLDDDGIALEGGTVDRVMDELFQHISLV